MFGIRKNNKKKSKQTAIFIKNLLSPYLQKISETIRIDGRIRLANRWGRKHPRRLMFYYAVFSVTLLAVTLITDIMNHAASDTSDVLKISDIPQMYNRLNFIQSQEGKQELIKHEIADLYGKGLILYNELDSLQHLQNKSHQDSIRIITIYQALNSTFINKTDYEP